MTKLDHRIFKFISKMDFFTICVLHEGLPYSANCFYKFDNDRSLIFASSQNSIHIKSAQNSQKVAINIAKFSKKIANLQGLQAQGILSNASENEKNEYQKSYPMASLMDTQFYKITLTNAKFTDNTLGFGKKILWNF